MKNRNYRFSGIIVLILGIVLVCIPLANLTLKVQNVAKVSFLDRLGLTGGYEQELQVGESVSIVDEKTGAVIDEIARVVYPGDETINEANEIYKVVRIKGNKAFAVNSGVARDIVWRDEWDTLPAVTVKPAQTGKGKPQIAIYHTHSDESYVPTDGSSSIPAHGGIFKVGSALASQLKARGITALDDKTPHEPHDANAYHRSRRTAVKLMKEKPMALLDVHRDGVEDPDFYNNEVQGHSVTRVRLVVGRQNPNMSTNLDFAKKVKAYMDKHKPGIIRGIFIGHGSYNQDLSPTALLLEVGTHTNDRYRAERGADVFADAFPAVLKLKTTRQPGGGPGTTPYSASPSQNGGAWKAVGWIIGAVLIGGAMFLLISTGSLQGMKSKLGELRKTEFANFFGLKKGNRKGPALEDRQDNKKKR